MKKMIFAVALVFGVAACHHPQCDPSCPEQGHGTVEFCPADSSWFINMYSWSQAPGSVLLVHPVNMPTAFQLNGSNVQFKFEFTGDSTTFNCSGCGTPPLPQIPNVKICEMQQDTSGGVIIMKPVIYLYPEKEQEVHVDLRFQGEYTTTYPAYNWAIHGWNVLAKPDGELYDARDGQVYPYLFWEGKPSVPYVFDWTQGYCVAGSETRTFLQKILPQLGLLPREYHDMIVFWLPHMEKNAWNLIHFATEAYTSKAPLKISPKPDALIRVFMAFKASEHPVAMQAPQLVPTSRKGFTVVEWGGVDMSLTKVLLVQK